jgi:hypothetical protein
MPNCKAFFRRRIEEQLRSGHFHNVSNYRLRLSDARSKRGAKQRQILKGDVILALKRMI